MSESREEKARRMLEKGALYFILVNGVVKFGGILFLINPVTALLFNPKRVEAIGFINLIFDAEYMLICAIIGLFFGAAMWILAISLGRLKNKSGMK